MITISILQRITAKSHGTPGQTRPVTQTVILHFLPRVSPEEAQGSRGQSTKCCSKRWPSMVGTGKKLPESEYLLCIESALGIGHMGSHLPYPEKSEVAPREIK